MGTRHFEHGDQVEVRVIVWFTPGECDLQGRVVNTQWRGDIAVDSVVGRRTTLKNQDEAAVFAASAAAGTYESMRSLCVKAEDQQLLLFEPPGPLVS